MLTFKELRRRLAEVNTQYDDVYESLEEYLFFTGESTFYIYRADTIQFLLGVCKALSRPRNDPQTRLVARTDL